MVNTIQKIWLLIARSFVCLRMLTPILFLVTLSACKPVIETVPPDPLENNSTNNTVAKINSAPNAPALLTCLSNPVGGSTNNACTLTAATPADPDGDTVSYVDDESTCLAVSVSILTGDVTFTAPAKGVACLVKVKSFDGSLYSSAVSSATITGTNNIPNTPSSLACVTSPLGGSSNNVCTLTAAGTPDPDGDTVSYVVDGASTCTSIVVNSSTGNATFTAPAKGATCLVKIKAFDGAANSSAVTSATITGSNNIPNTPTTLSCATSPLAGSTGNTCTLTAAGTPDPDGDAVSYLNDGSTCPSTIVNSSTGGVTFTAPANGASCAIHVKAYDGSAYSISVSSTINGTNNAPNIPSSLSCVTSPLGGSANNACTLTAAGTPDPDGDTVTYAVDGASTCTSIVVNSSTGNATFTAPTKGLTCLVKIKAFDGSLYSSAISSATITGANNAPNIPSSLSCVTSPIAGTTGIACTLTAAGTPDPDGDAVTYAVDAASTCTSIVVNSSTGNATFTAPANGATCKVLVKAFDSALYSTAVTSATITGANNAPNIPTSLTCVTSPLGGSAGNACTLTAAGTPDPDGNAVSYAVDAASTCGSISVSAVTGNATFTAPAKGATCKVLVKAFDGFLYSTAVSSETITGANNAPNIPTSLSCVASALAGSTGNACSLIAAIPVDADGGTVTYVDGGSSCASPVINSTTGNATFTTLTKGNSCVMKVKAFDGSAYSSVVSSATVTSLNNAPNTPISLSCSTSPVAASTGNACTLTAASPADVDGDTVSYVDGGSSCASPTINSSTGAMTFTAPALGVSCVVKLKAYDGTAYSNVLSSATITGAAGGGYSPTVSAGSVSLLGASGMSTIEEGSEDDDYVGITLPFGFSIAGSSYADWYVGSNTYITAGGGATDYNELYSDNPGYPKFHLGAADNSYQRVYVVSGTNFYRIKYEGTAATVGTVGSPNIEYEFTFYRPIGGIQYVQVVFGSQNADGEFGIASASDYYASGSLTSGSSYVFQSNSDGTSWTILPNSHITGNGTNL